MEFGNVKRRVVRKKDVIGEQPTVKYEIIESPHPYNLELYKKHPNDVINLEDFEKIAWHRFNVLKAVEDMKERHGADPKEYMNQMNTTLSSTSKGAYFPVAFPVESNQWKILSSEEKRKWKRDDLVGNYILRLAFCRTPEDQKWLITNEVDLFRFRFQHNMTLSDNSKRDDLTQFLRDNSIDVEQLSEDEKLRLGEEMMAGCAYANGIKTTSDFWKINFTAASDLVRRRKCFLKGGMAYLPTEDLQYILSTHYRVQLAMTLNRAYKYLPNIQNESNRLKPFLEKLANRAYIGKEFLGGDSTQITRHMIEPLSKDFPLCMRNIHQSLRAEHHLKHGARQQYGLFLKAIGLPLEEALAFMREEFTKKIDSDKFEKQYAYNVRHMYGKEGRRKDYAAMPCQLIILGAPPTAGDCHGCPYKHQDTKVLERSLLKDGLNKVQVEKILNFTKVSRFDKACTRQFEFARGMMEGGLGQLVTHPNQYYEFAIQVRDGKRHEEHIEVLKSQTPASHWNSQVTTNDIPPATNHIQSSAQSMDM
ncbi:unnamed protein product, partial [Mesorhabditis belari]|uniref:DNA primase large subunit n=1 Tax=Mesorhabditis belari TaxID=2138241 RepID=A0AAF3ET74_9BILA